MRIGRTTLLKTQGLTGWLMAGPAVFLIVLFLIVPFMLAFYFSFTNQRLVAPHPARFVGLANYEQLFGIKILTREPQRDKAGNLLHDDDGQLQYLNLRHFTRDRQAYPNYFHKREWISWVWGQERVSLLVSDLLFVKSLVNTFLFVIIIAPVQSILALGLALLINQKLKGISIFRAIYFMPVVMSLVVVSLLWRFIYNGDNGLLNMLLSQLTFGFFKPVRWLGDSNTALGAIIVMSIWQGVGFQMVIWLSGLQTIAGVLYEAATIDGAGRFAKFRDVTWPGLRHTAVLIVIVITMQAFSVFSQIDVMTKGGPVDSTQTIVFQAVQRGFGQQNIGGGSAISVVLFLIVLSISLLQAYLTRERDR